MQWQVPVSGLIDAPPLTFAIGSSSASGFAIGRAATEGAGAAASEPLYVTVTGDSSGVVPAAVGPNDVVSAASLTSEIPLRAVFATPGLTPWLFELLSTSTADLRELEKHGLPVKRNKLICHQYTPPPPPPVPASVARRTSLSDDPTGHDPVGLSDSGGGTRGRGYPEESSSNSNSDTFPKILTVWHDAENCYVPSTEQVRNPDALSLLCEHKPSVL